MSRDQRQYEVVVFGATGYTGKYTAEHVATQLPTDLRWAIAGRSEAKLKSVAEELRQMNPDRVEPGIELASIDKADLVSLAKKTKVLISAVGPYHKYGEAAFQACAETGTHYLDCTGEVPWVYDMVEKYDAVAKKTGAIMIPQTGVESAIPDLMCWLLVSHIRRTLSCGTAEVLNAIYEMKTAPSGGTLDTLLSLFESYSLSHIAKTMSPFSLCTTTPPKQSRSPPLTEKLTGMRTDEELGLLTDSLSGTTDAPIINRSWSLFEGGRFYGPRFQLSSYMKADNAVYAVIVHLGLTLGVAALILPPVRWLIRQFIYQPGEGTPREQAKKEHCEWRAIANADVSDPRDPKRASGRIRWEGSMYHLTAVVLAEAAIVLARENEKSFAQELGGGVLTPATLGASYLERLQKAGLQVEVKTLP
ncbi:trans-acting enoyl reductase Rv2449c [Lecanosticta acicola]|uniref:Trans-acting enoyl reductase Rv2449c n=1 Tax=Lecanosticta acicola TaxID=111012 RepID=A0AAI8Z284_9PEZI|nr:trans-acting enoyl reductase Rv2449c [Lecanosticta acicola]